MSDPSDTSGPGLYFWRYPSWNMLGTVTWALTFGLDVLDPNPQIWSKEQGSHMKNWSGPCGPHSSTTTFMQAGR